MATSFTSTATAVTGAAVAAATSGTTNLGRWTVRRLADHLMAETERNPDGSAVAPGRVLSLVRESLSQVWVRHPWKWRRKRYQLALLADATTAALPDDFCKLDTTWVIENNRNGTVKFTEDPQTFEYARDVDSNAGTPQRALIENDTSESDWRWLVRFDRPPTSAFEYELIYLTLDPVAQMRARATATFTAVPADGATIVVDGTTFELDTDSSVTEGNTAIDTSDASTVDIAVMTIASAINAALSTVIVTGDPAANTVTAVSTTDGATVTMTLTGSGWTATTETTWGLADNQPPIMPAQMFLGWQMLARLRVLRAFGRESMVPEAASAWRDWLRFGTTENDEQLTANEDVIESNGDFESLTSSTFGGGDYRYDSNGRLQM